MMRRQLIALVLTTASLHACGPIYDVGQSTVDGPLQAPATAKVGQSVTVNLVTSGSSGCYSGDHVEVKVDQAQRRVVLTPYVKERRGGLCSTIVIAIPMAASFTPLFAGTYRLEAAGLRRNGLGWEPTVWTADIEVSD
jgi:hypothetical protein